MYSQNNAQPPFPPLSQPQGKGAANVGGNSQRQQLQQQQQQHSRHSSLQGVPHRSPQDVKAEGMQISGESTADINQWYPPGHGMTSNPLVQVGGLPPGMPYASTNSPQSVAGKKSKRRPDGESPGGTEEKRTKTGRACDACRSKKIRCDILSAATAPGAQPICAHCKQYNIECTFFLPITETRFKKRRAAPDEPSPRVVKPVSNGAVEDVQPKGGSSILSLVHSTLPNRSFEQFDMANHAYWEAREDDNGQIQMTVAAGVESPNGDESSRVTKYVLPPPLMTKLVNAYFDNGSEYLPIVSRRDFINSHRPYPLLLYTICGLAATGRDFARQIFNRLRGLVNGLLRANDILSHARIEHVQSLLIMAEAGELHAQPTAPTASAAMMRLSSAVRMAQDLGLHREQQGGTLSVEETELRRRIWAACVFMEKWYAAVLGLPVLVDVLDCDVPLPSPYRLQPGGPPVFEPTFAALAENLKLSILLGRVLKTVYGPTGLRNATDEQLNAILDDMHQWREELPDHLKFTGSDSCVLAGLLHMEFTAIQFIFWRGFMRVTPPPPSHLKLILNVAKWTDLVNWSRQCIEWLDQHDEALDTVFIFPYTATSCALVQYHMWARRRDPTALETLKLTRDVIARWEALLQPDQMSIRKKSCETMTLLYEAALRTIPDNDDRTDRSEGTPTSSTSGATSSVRAEQPAFGHRQNYQLSTVNGNSEGSHVVQYSLEADTTAATNFDEGYDVSFLDNIPDSNFDWSGWGQYFDTVDRMFPSQDE